MSYDILVSHVSQLWGSLLSSWMQQGKWKSLREDIDQLAISLDDNTIYLRQQTKIVKEKQSSLSVADSGAVKVLPVNASVSSRIQPLNAALQEKPVYEVNSFALGSKQKYNFIRDLEKGLPVSTVLFTCSAHSVNYHYLWRIPDGVTLESATNQNVQIITQIREELPSYP